jgi:hypothetical protein
MPPDFPLAEAFNAVIRIKGKPEKVFHQDHPQVKAEQETFQPPPPRNEEKLQMDQSNQENGHKDVVAGDGSAARELYQPSFFDSPAGRISCPAVLTLNLDFPQSQDNGHQDHESQQSKNHFNPFFYNMG